MTYTEFAVRFIIVVIAIYLIGKVIYWALYGGAPHDPQDPLEEAEANIPRVKYLVLDSCTCRNCRRQAAIDPTDIESGC